MAFSTQAWYFMELLSLFSSSDNCTFDAITKNMICMYANSDICNRKIQSQCCRCHKLNLIVKCNCEMFCHNLNLCVKVS